MAGSSFDDDGGGIRPDRPYRVDLEQAQYEPADGESDGRRGQIGRVMQKLFFPDQYAKEQLLLDAMEDFAQARSERELARALVDAVDQALTPEVVHVFVRRAVRFRLLRSTERHDDDRVLLPTGFRLGVLAAEWHEPRAGGSLPDLGHEERAWLRSWQVRWIVPMRHPDPQVGLCGLLLLGGRQGGYSAVQRDLLYAAAGRFALEHCRHVQKRVGRLAESRGRGGWLLECPECGRCYGDGSYFCDDDDATIEPTLLVERDVAGRYRLEQRLGKGGMGRVYRARDLEDDRRLAVKILTGGDQVALGRFANEARAGRKIRHPQVVEFIDSGTVGRYGAYLVMEYIEGVTLRDELKRRGALDPAELASWLDGVLEAVAAAHEAGIIHRDLKPENIMLTDGQAKVLDFGLAKLHESGSGPQNTLTGTGMVVGTLAYMSPEQLHADRIDHRTDLYTLAIIAAECLTGRLPFEAEGLGEMLQAVTYEPFRMHVTGKEQAGVADVLSKALEKEPELRYPDVESLRKALIPALRTCPPFDPPGAA